jgi:WD40 repeat protein
MGGGMKWSIFGGVFCLFVLLHAIAAEIESNNFYRFNSFTEIFGTRVFFFLWYVRSLLNLKLQRREVDLVGLRCESPPLCVIYIACLIVRDKMVRLWVRNEEGRFQESESSPMEGHRYGVNQVEFSPNGELLASCSLDGSTILWDSGVCIS